MEKLERMIFLEEAIKDLLHNYIRRNASLEEVELALFNVAIWYLEKAEENYRKGDTSWPSTCGAYRSTIDPQMKRLHENTVEAVKELVPIREKLKENLK